MNTALLVVTLASLALTGAVLIYLARILREDRERSQARVLALAQEIGNRDTARAAEPRASVWPGGPLARQAGGARPASSREEPPGHARLENRPTEGNTTIATADASPGAALFRGHDEAPDGAPGRRMLGPLVGAVVVGLAVLAIWAFGGPAGSPPEAAAPPSAAERSLELVSLAHEVKDGALRVSGLVRNPEAGRAREGLAAVVFVFDGTGTFVTSARAPIDYQILGAGDESPFVVSVPNASAVARYRVSFRDAEALVHHVDARIAPAPGERQ